ncbi:unnamed protein product [Trichobilharzia szidati]|nr:unnamed protein product [Trichobilharzia szidati]
MTLLHDMSSQTRLAMNHGSLKLQPFMVNGTINLTQDFSLVKTGDESNFYLSPLPAPLANETTTSNNAIPGMQEIFDKLASRPHPSPILAATLTKFGNHVDLCQESVSNKDVFNSSAPPSHNGSDSSKKLQFYLKSSQIETSSSSSLIDLSDFPSSPISGAFADFQSLRYIPLNLDCSSSANISLSTANSVLDQCVDDSDCLPVYSNCPPNLDEEETDLVPSELVQFVSESTRQIPSDLTDVVSAGDSDIEDLDHEARLASLCIPILRSPSLGHSNLLDNAQPPTLSPESSGCPHSPFDHIDISSDPSYEKSYFSQTPEGTVEDVNKQHVLSPKMNIITNGALSDELISRNDTNNHDPLLSTTHINSSNFISNSSSFTYQSDNRTTVENCSSSVMHSPTSGLSENKILPPITVCSPYKIPSLSTTTLPPSSVCVSQIGSFTLPSIQNHFILKDVVNCSNLNVSNAPNFQCIVTKSMPDSSTTTSDGTYNNIAKTPSLVNLVCSNNEGGKQLIFPSKSDRTESLDFSVVQNYNRETTQYSEQIIKTLPQSNIRDSSLIPNLRFTTIIGSNSQNTPLAATPSRSISSISTFDQNLSSNIEQESICEPNKGVKQLIVSSEIRSLITTSSDHPFASTVSTVSCPTGNTSYIEVGTPYRSKEGSCVAQNPLILSTPTFQIAPHPVSTQSTFVVSHAVTPGVVSHAELQPTTPIVLSLKSRPSVEVPQPQVTNLTSSSGCVLLPLQILNSLPTVNPGMSILLNIKNGNPVRQNPTPCLPNFASMNTLSDKSCPITPETNGTVFLLPTSNIVTNLNGNVSNIPILQLPSQQQYVNFLPSTFTTPLLSNSSISSPLQNSPTLVNSFNTPQVDIKQSIPGQLPSGTQFFILRSASKSNIINPAYFTPTSSSSPSSLLLSSSSSAPASSSTTTINTVNGAAFTPLSASSTGLTVVLANPSSHKNPSESGNLVFLPTASTRSNIFPLCTNNTLTSNFSTTSSGFITAAEGVPLAAAAKTTTLSWTPVSNFTNHDSNRLVNNNNNNSTTAITSSNTKTSTSSTLNYQSSVDNLNDTSFSLPLTLLPNIPQQTMILSSSSWNTHSPNNNNNNSGSNVFTTSQSFNTHAFLSPATTLSSSSMSSSSCMSFDNNSLPSPPISYSNVSVETSKSNQSVNSSPTVNHCLLPPVSALSSPINPNNNNNNNNNNKDYANSKVGISTLTLSNNQQNETKTNVIVLPSADKLLSSRNYSQISSVTAQTNNNNNKLQESKCRRISSYSSPNTPSIPSTTVTVSTTTTAAAAALMQTVVTSSKTVVTCCSRRRHQCPYCPKSCERKDNLQAHIRTHTGERPYPCRYCPKAFPQKDHLRAHIRTHTGEKPYRCPQCLKAFAQLGNLHRHVKTHRR